MAVRIASRISSSVRGTSSKQNKNGNLNTKTTSKSTKTVVQAVKKTGTSRKGSIPVIMATGAVIAAKSITTTVQSKTTNSLGIGKSTGISYLNDAPKIYTASGQVSTYNQSGKSYSLQGGNTSNASLLPNIGVSSFTCGRPAQSYVDEKKVKSFAKNNISLPVATKKPEKRSVKKSKGKEGTTKKLIDYLPSPSRSGKGKKFEREKTNPTVARDGASLMVSFIPLAGDAKDVQETITGVDLITGKKLSKADRIITAGTIALPVVSGKSVRAVKSGAKAVKKPTKKVVKATLKKAKKITKEVTTNVTKDVEKKAGTVAKNLKDVKKTLVDELDEAGKKINTKVKEKVKIKIDPVNGVVKGKGGSSNNSLTLDDLAENIVASKPKNSPNLQKWLEKDGKIYIEEDGTWRYTNPNGQTVSYPNGYPDFKKAGLVKQEVDIGEFSDYVSDFKKADKLAPNGPRDSLNNTWHHVEDGRTLQEINKAIHKEFTHRGGMSLKKN